MKPSRFITNGLCAIFAHGNAVGDDYLFLSVGQTNVVPSPSVKLKAVNGDLYDGEWKKGQYHGSGERKMLQTIARRSLPVILVA
jgi:hypothetical protein